MRITVINMLLIAPTGKEKLIAKLAIEPKRRLGGYYDCK